MTNTTPRRRDQAGASLLEYLMLLSFVAVIGIIGLRTVGPVAAGLFDTERLGLGATPPAEVLGVTVERDVTIGTAVTIERPPAACIAGPGRGGAHPVCPL